MTIRLLANRVLRGMAPIRSLALRALKGVARPVVLLMPPIVQLRARRAWRQLKGSATLEHELESPDTALTPAAARVWQDLIEARAMAAREPLDGAPDEQQEGRRARPA